MATKIETHMEMGMKSVRKLLFVLLATSSAATVLPASAASFRAVLEKGSIVVYATAEVPETCSTTFKYYTYNDGKWKPETFRCESNVIARKNVRFCTSKVLEAERIELDSNVERNCTMQ